MQHFGKGALRIAKNYTKGYSDTQAKVRDATSNDAWGPSGTLMNEIAQLTYNQADFVEIMEMLDKRLNDKGKNWRHVFKSLTVLDYCLHAGSEHVVMYFRDNIYIIKTLKEFQYVDEDGKDQGANVRQKAKDITNLLQDETRLREERRTRAHMRERMTRGGTSTDLEPNEDENDRRTHRSGALNGKPPAPDREQEDLQRAIEESKKLINEANAEEQDLQKAIRLSEEEEAKRHKAVEDSNAASLFDDQNQTPSSSNNPFPIVDTASFSTGLQPQFTQLQPQFTQVQPQFTAFSSFNPYQQQAQQEALQAEYLRKQQEWLQQQQLQQQQLQQQQNQDTIEAWMRQQQLQAQLTAQPIVPQPTSFGSNNPFAPSSNIPPVPSLPQTSSPASLPSFNLGTYANTSTDASSISTPSSFSPQLSSSSSPLPMSQRPSTKADQTHAQLANLFANRDDGQDTFGNIGLLRYGQTDAGRLLAQKSGHNPFSQQQQQQQQQSNHQPFFEI